jgi:hypothetical protein
VGQDRLKASVADGRSGPVITLSGEADLVPLEYRVTRSELGLRGVVIFVDYSRDDGFRRTDRRLATSWTGCVSMSGGRCCLDWCGR